MKKWRKAFIWLVVLCPACVTLLFGCNEDLGGLLSQDDGGTSNQDDGGNSDPESALQFPIVDTQQTSCYGTDGSIISCPSSQDAPLFGQDGSYPGRVAVYKKNGDGTVSDEVTGLIWQQSPSLSTYANAASICANATTAGKKDWRVPTIKELYSLIDFRGQTGTATNMDMTSLPDDAIAYINTDAFTFYYGNEVDLGNGGPTGSRYIDSQYISATEYVSTVMDNMPAFFGVNFADGRIKGYPASATRFWFLMCVRGGSAYGKNDLIDLGDGTINDRATGLVWMKQDSGQLGAGATGDGKMDWPAALAWCEGLEHAGYGDWRVPNAKELQSIVDYTHSPDTTNSAALSQLFEATGIINEAGQADFGWYWTGTTHLDGRILGTAAIYVTFGRALGYFHNAYLDVHGAGAQRGDPKVADAEDIGCGMGPQGDCRRVYNLVRCVRGGSQ